MLFRSWTSESQQHRSESRTAEQFVQENFNVFDFTLNEDDMQKIQALDEAESAFFSHYDPETVEFLASFGK